jgi:hypothetical protein
MEVRCMKQFNDEEVEILAKLVREEIKSLDFIITQKKEEIGNNIDVLENNKILNKYIKYKGILDILMVKLK